MFLAGGRINVFSIYISNILEIQNRRAEMTALIKTLQSYGFSQRRITVDRVVLALLLGLALLTAWDQTKERQG